MDYVLLVALVLFCIASFLAIHFSSRLSKLQNDYKLQQELLQSVEKQRDVRSQDYYDMARKADVFEKCIRGLEESNTINLELQRKHLEAAFELQARSIRADAVQRAKVVNKGFDGETFSPFLIQGWSAKDFRHIGDPIDYMVFIGAEDVRAGLQDELDGVVILEVKTGGSDLNKVQRRIRDAVVNGDVEFALYNADDKTIRVWSQRDPKGKDVRQQS